MKFLILSVASLVGIYCRYSIGENKIRLKPPLKHKLEKPFIKENMMKNYAYGHVEFVMKPMSNTLATHWYNSGYAS